MFILKYMISLLCFKFLFPQRRTIQKSNNQQGAPGGLQRSIMKWFSGCVNESQAQHDERCGRGDFIERCSESDSPKCSKVTVLESWTEKCDLLFQHGTGPLWHLSCMTMMDVAHQQFERWEALFRTQWSKNIMWLVGGGIQEELRDWFSHPSKSKWVITPCLFTSWDFKITVIIMKRFVLTNLPPHPKTLILHFCTSVLGIQHTSRFYFL